MSVKKWVMSDEIWVMNDEWWKLSDYFLLAKQALSIENPALKSQVSDGYGCGNPNHKALKTHHLKSATPIGGRVPIEIKPATPICC